jgi:hypothetical protein
MFTRTVELTPKSGKARELANTINEKVLPILKKQPGFVDETLLVSDAEPNQIASFEPKGLKTGGFSIGEWMLSNTVLRHYPSVKTLPEFPRGW